MLEATLPRFYNSSTHWTNISKNRNTSSSSAIFTKIDNSIENISIAQLCIGAVFFVIHSCKYLQTNIHNKKQYTKTIQLRDLYFYRKGSIIPHNNAKLDLADTIIITFEFHKIKERHKSVIIYCSGDPLLCPLQAWASVSRSVLLYPGTNKNSPVYRIYINSKISTISSSILWTKLHSAVDNIDVDRLGFTVLIPGIT